MSRGGLLGQQAHRSNVLSFTGLGVQWNEKAFHSCGSTREEHSGRQLCTQKGTLSPLLKEERLSVCVALDRSMCVFRGGGRRDRRVWPKQGVHTKFITLGQSYFFQLSWCGRSFLAEVTQMCAGDSSSYFYLFLLCVYHAFVFRAL